MNQARGSVPRRFPSDHALRVVVPVHGLQSLVRDERYDVRAMRSKLRLAFLVCLAWLARPAQAQDLVGLYAEWIDDPTTTMAVNWVDLYPDSSDTLLWRKEGDAEWRNATAEHTTITPSTLQRRSVQLKGLAPDTRYQIAIGQPPGKDAPLHFFRTMPKDLAARPVRFLEGGDTMATRERFESMNRIAMQQDPDFVLFGGDLAYENGKEASRVVDWLQAWMKTGVAKGRRLVPLVVAIGNHEVRGGYNGKAPVDAPYFYGVHSLPEGRAWRALDFGSYLSLVLLDSGHTTPIDGAQTDWLQRTLEERADRTFLFAAYHYPAYGTTKAPKGGTPLDVPVAAQVRKHWTPLFEQHGLTAAFEHDQHNFKRSHRIRAGKRDDENGVLYLGDGAWGVVVRTVPKEGEAWWLAKAEPRNHFWCVDLKHDGTATLRAIDGTGEVFDTVELATPRTLPVRPAR